ncbi:hypothetical protein ABZ686_03705 [Streptomyces sp. NPDC006992]|uniref:hypothetical protein n=1 Tax=unclassified Streptomyces TaxID=2593676 RepID=UPI0033E25FDD
MQGGDRLAPEQYGPRELILPPASGREVHPAIAAEAAGCDFVELSDHYHPWDPRGFLHFCDAESIGRLKQLAAG